MNPPPKNTFAVVFLILAISSVVSTIIGWFNSVDVKGWWPVGITIYFLIDCVYAFAFATLIRSQRPISLFFVIAYNTTLGVLLVLHSVLFYGTKPGAGGWQELVRSDRTVYGAFGAFLIGAAVFSHIRRPRGRNG